MPVATEQKESSEMTLDAELSLQKEQRRMDTDDDASSKASSDFDTCSGLQQPESPTQLSGSKSPITPTQSNAKTVIIFDWDDTLLASSFLSAKGYRLDNNMQRCCEVDAQLKQLEKSVSAVLSLALRYGEVHVITNAETGWVQLSAQKFIPAVLPLLEKVTVISARSTYEQQYPEMPLKWKVCAFQDNLTKQFTQSDPCIKNIISFGDSHVEREAVRTVSRSFSNVKTKSVKFAERPSMEQLRRQIDLVTNCFEYIYSHEGDLDLMLTISLVY
jgi:hypothetical protein